MYKKGSTQLREGLYCEKNKDGRKKGREERGEGRRKMGKRRGRKAERE